MNPVTKNLSLIEVSLSMQNKYKGELNPKVVALFMSKYFVYFEVVIFVRTFSKWTLNK